MIEAELEDRNGLGARARKVRRFGAQLIELQSEVTLGERPHHLRAEGGMGSVRSTADYHREPIPAGCRVRVHLQPAGLPPVLGPGFQRQTAAGFAEALAGSATCSRLSRRHLDGRASAQLA